jgi:hypothetical protein
MARKNKEQEVRSAFHAVLADGFYPTYDRVLEQMGGGSKATIRKYLPALREEYGDELDKVAPRDEMIPQEFSVIFRRFYNQLLNRMEDKHESEEVKRLEAENDQLREDNTAMLKQLEDNKNVMEKMTAKMEQMEKTIKILEKALDIKTEGGKG